MLPIIVDITSQKLVLIGRGSSFERRLELVKQAGAEDILFNPEVIPPNAIVFIAGLPLEESKKHQRAAKAAGALVNVEEMPDLCDFHMPAQVRRGDLLLTISTGGRSPALSRLLRLDLEQHYGIEWADRLDQISKKRTAWQAQGLTMTQISQAVRKMVEDKAWIR